MMLEETTVLPMPRCRAHCGPVREQVLDADGEVVIRIEQARAAGDDAVAVVVGVAGPGDVEVVFVGDQAGHGVGAGAVHADAAVPVEGHEAEGGVDVCG